MYNFNTFSNLLVTTTFSNIIFQILTSLGQWIRMRLPSYRPGFNSQAERQFIVFFTFCHFIAKRTKINRTTKAELDFRQCLKYRFDKLAGMHFGACRRSLKNDFGQNIFDLTQTHKMKYSNCNNK